LLRFFQNRALKGTIFLIIQKGQKIAKPFHLWQTVSKRPSSADLDFLKAKWQPCLKNAPQRIK